MQASNEKALAFINEHFANGRSVQVTTSLKGTRWSPNMAQKYRAAGIEPFKLSKTGDLLMAQGKKYVTVILSVTKLEAF